MVTKPTRPTKEKVMYFLPVLLFFLWESITLFYSTDKKEGLSILGTQAILAVASLAFIFNRIKTGTVAKALYMFLIGCVSSLLILYSIAFYSSSSIIGDAFVFRPFFEELGNTIVDSDTKGHFFAGNHFSQFVHPAYLALLLGIGMLIILQGIKLGSKLLARKRLWLTSFTFLGISIISMSLNASSVLIVVISLAILAYLSVKNLLYGDLSRGIYSSVLVFLLFFLLNPQVNILMTEKMETPSIVLKQEINQASKKLLVDNWLLGVGIGDMDNELRSIYRNCDNEHIAERCPNPHNQFMTTWLQGGLPAIGLLLWIFVSISMRAYRKKTLLLHAISALFIISFLFESMLLRYWGVITFTLFYGLLYFYTEKPTKESHMEEEQDSYTDFESR